MLLISFAAKVLQHEQDELAWCMQWCAEVLLESSSASCLPVVHAKYLAVLLRLISLVVMPLSDAHGVV